TVVVCPSFVKSVWARELERWWPKAKFELLATTKPKEIDKTLDVVVIHYDVLHAWVSALLEWGATDAIFDECFPAGTKVSTPNGSKNIESLCIGDAVENAIGTGYVRGRGRQTVSVDDLTLVRTDDGREFICTCEHPILVYREGLPDWVTAISLRHGDCILDIVRTQALWCGDEKT